MIIASIVTLTICVGISFVLWDIYRWDGNLSLSNVKEGQVINLMYAQPLNGTYKRHFVKVVNISSLTERDIKRLNDTSKYRKDDKAFQRSEKLIRGVTGKGEFRQFYDARCYYAHKPILGKILFRLGVI